jgi:serine/threonine-protein kinase RsbW
VSPSGRPLEHIFRIRNRQHDVPGVLNRVEESCRAQGLAGKTALDIRLVVEEVLTNIVTYAHEAAEERSIDLRVSTSSKFVRIEFRDEGAPFNPLDAPAPDLQTRLEEREIGGLGIYLARSLVDDAKYSREGSVNVLVLTKQVGFTV